MSIIIIVHICDIVVFRTFVTHQRQTRKVSTSIYSYVDFPYLKFKKKFFLFCMFLFLSYVFHSTLPSNNPTQISSADTLTSHKIDDLELLLRRLAFVLVSTSMQGGGCILFGTLFLTSMLLTSLDLHILSPVGFGLAACLYTRRNILFRLINRQNRALRPLPPSLLLLSSSHVTVSPSIEFPPCEITINIKINKKSQSGEICEPKNQRSTGQTDTV